MYLSISIFKKLFRSKVMKLTEISIMDRQSNGSFIVKDRLVDTHKVVNISGNDVNKNDDNKEVNIVINTDKTLKNIDEKMMSIDRQLDDIEN